MSFRREIKATLSKSKLFQLINWIYDQKGEILYPERTINSVYFDNLNLNMYHQSVEGVLPRKKIRLRTYNSENSLNEIKKKSSLEFKISSVEGRFKISKNKFLLNDKHFSINDKDYGTCYPVLNVIYKRLYFKINNIRLTIDRDINYKVVKNYKIFPYIIRDNLNVVELKYQKTDLDQKVFDFFPFQFNRFSKYCRGIEFTQNKICDEII
ncbi:VTC domain-containing protein [Pelagibacteraceae bacterium]|jgi:SPX domain protein involved in polyphosphate accumulation|nr:VTC domain-containing protein [Pelagibacteraceae bacterium]